MKKPTLVARTKPHIQNSNGKAKHRLPERQFPDRLVIKIKEYLSEMPEGKQTGRVQFFLRSEIRRKNTLDVQHLGPT
jgi:hypothetical protein